MAFEAYSVAVKVQLTGVGAFTNSLMAISGAFRRVHGDATKLQGQLDKIKFTLLAGGAMAGAGILGLGLIERALPYAKEYARQLALMNTLGMRQTDIARVVSQAWRTSGAVPSMTAAHALETFRELRSAFGSDPRSQAEAAAMLPIVGQLEGVLRSLTGKPADHVGFDMVKAIELRTGVMTTAALTHNAQLMSQALIGMGGTLSVQDFHQTLKMAKSALGNGQVGWSDDFTYRYLPTLMQEVKTRGGFNGGNAGSAGTYLMTLYRGDHGRIQKNAMPYWVESGLVRAQDLVKNATGSWQIRPGAVKGTQLAETNPYAWANQILKPGLERIMAREGVSMSTAINAMFSDRNAAFVAQNMILKAAQYERDAKTIGKADNYTAYRKLLQTDPTLAQAALSSQWQNVMAEIGFSIMPTLVRGSLMLVGALRDLSTEMRRHPRLVTAATAAFVALAGALTISGGLMLVAGTISAIGIIAPVVSAGIGAIGAACVAFLLPAGLAVGAAAALAIGLGLLARHWREIGPWVANATHVVLEKIRSLVTQAGSAITGWLHNILQWVRDHMPSFGTPWQGGGPAPLRTPGAAGGVHVGALVGGEPGRSGAVGPLHAKPQTHITVPVHLDGRKIAEVVATHIADGISHVHALGRHDPNATLAAVGAGYRR